MREYLTIGEMASIFKMDVQLLRHYDAKGLLVPYIRNEENGRRFYRFDQMYTLATIRYLRKLGYPLKKIDSFLKARDVSGTIQTLREHSAALRAQYEDLLQTDRIIQDKLAFIQRESQKATPNKPHIQEFPVRDYVLIGGETSLFTNELFYFYPTVGFYRGQEKSFGAYLYDDTKNLTLEHSSEVQVSRIKAGRYICSYHMGPYANIHDSICALLDLGAEYALDDTVVTINIVDQFLESHPENYLTELQVLILE